MRKLAAELRCVVCQNQSLLESDSQIAKDLKELILEMYVNGKSDEEIKEYLVDRYGEFILFRPKFSINNILLWFAPLVFLLIISLLAFRKLSFFKNRKMILYFFFIILIVALIIIFSFRTVNEKKSKKSYLKLKIILFTLLSLIATTLYLKLSNYWIGGTVLDKIENQTNIENRKANEIAIIQEAMISLEKELIKNPKSLETIMELAKLNFF